MQPVDRESLNRFKARLLEERRSASVCASKEAVKAALSTITKARERRVNWDRIAELLMETTEIKLSSSTLRRYYYELSQERGKALLKKESNPSKLLKQRKQKTETPSESDLAHISPKATDVQHLEVSSNGSQAELTSVPDESDSTSIVEAALLEAALRKPGSFSHWQEPEFNVNQVRPANTDP